MMRSERIASLLLITLILASVNAFASTSSPTRGRLDLDGEWTFAADPNDVGETEEWFAPEKALPTEQPEGYSPAKPGFIEVPGIWDAQGYGAETDKIKHNFVGKGWYKRTISVPSDWDAANTAVLTLEGISRSAKIWVGGRQVGGELVGCVGAHEVDLTQYVEPGRDACLTICVNSAQDWSVDPLLGSASLDDYLEINWGGLWGHVYLESRPKTRLDSIYLRTRLDYAGTEVSRASCVVETTLLDETRSTFSGKIKTTVRDKEGVCVATAFADVKALDLSSGSAKIETSAVVPNAKLWTPDTPYLYDVLVEFYAEDGALVDSLRSTYGMREIKFVGSRVYLNGKPFFLRGYGDDHVYPNEFSMSTDKETYRKRLELIKAFGFNHCRHHSTIMPHEYYDACDELGMLPNAEMLLGYPHQLPGEGSVWKKNVPDGADPGPALNTLKERWAAVVKEFRNHPSIFIWVGGNELCMIGWERWNNMPLGREFYDIAKALDPDRYFTDCDGDWPHEYEEFGPRKAQEFYSMVFNEWSDPVLNQDKFKTTIQFDRPVVSHESGNFLTFLRPDQIELFEGTNYKPFWMTDGKAKLDELGLADEVEDWAKASEQLYLLLHKYNVEGVRRNEALSGYHWWLIQDYWTTSNGLFDVFFRPKSVTPEDVLPFNSDLVLLQQGLALSAVSGEKASVTLMISNFAETSKKGRLAWSLTPIDPDSQAAKTWTKTTYMFGPVAAPNGKLTSFEPIEFVFPEVDEPTQAAFTLTLNADDGTRYENTWTTIVFPRTIAPTTKKTIYADSSALALFPEEWNVKPLSELQGELPSDAVYAVSWADDDVVGAVERGAGMIHFNASQFLKALPISYQQTWWKAGDDERQNNTGTFVYSNGVTEKLVDRNFCVAAWAPLLDGAAKYDVETKQARPEIMIRALSSLVLVRDEAILFEFGVGAGKTIVTGLNHKANKDNALNNYLLAKLVDEAASDRACGVQWDAKALVPPIVVPEGTLLGVQRIAEADDFDVWNSYRDMTGCAATYSAIQNKVGSRVVWQTQKAPKTDAQSVTFLFSGGTGYATEPKSKGFELAFNGAKALTFDVVDVFDGTNVFEWKSEDGSIVLQFDAKTELKGDDKYGIFRLTVPASIVQFDAPQEVSVTSIGDGSRRWFGVQVYTDFSDLIESEKN